MVPRLYGMIAQQYLPALSIDAATIPGWLFESIRSFGLWLPAMLWAYS